MSAPCSLVGPGDDGGVQEVALAEAARDAAEAFAVDLDVGAHLDERLGEAEAVLVDRLVHDRDALGLGQRDDERLLPVGHEAGVHVGLEDQRRQAPAGVVEPDAVVVDVEGRRRPCGRRSGRSSYRRCGRRRRRCRRWVASAAEAQEAASLRSGRARWL